MGGVRRCSKSQTVFLRRKPRKALKEDAEKQRIWYAGLVEPVSTNLGPTDGDDCELSVIGDRNGSRVTSV